MLRRWLDTPIIIWEHDWMPRAYHIYNTTPKTRLRCVAQNRPKLFDVVSLSPDAGDTWGPLRNGARESQRWEAPPWHWEMGPQMVGISRWVFLEGKILVGFHHPSSTATASVWHPGTQATGEIGTIDNYGAAVAGRRNAVGIFSKNAMFLVVTVTGWVSIPWCSLNVEYDIMMS